MGATKFPGKQYAFFMNYKMTQFWGNIAKFYVKRPKKEERVHFIWTWVLSFVD